jgi:hypothetical protein
MEDILICYRNNPNEPELVCRARVFGAPLLYKLYKSREEIEEGEEEEQEYTNRIISFGEYRD